MFSIKFTKTLPDDIFFAIVKYYKNYGYDESKIKKHFGIDLKQFQNIHQ